jgi:two-component system chemotaxis response regulator CheY
LPIIVLTTRGDDASRAAALQAGATSYLTKPFAPAALAAEATALIGKPAAAPDFPVGSR